MHDDALSHFIERTRRDFGPLTTGMVSAVRDHLIALAGAPSNEAWIAALYEALPASRELHRDAERGFVLLAHSEHTGLYRPPHDHGRSWVIYALARGEMEIGTYARVEDAQGGGRLVRRDTTTLREGEARIYLPGDIHDTRCVRGPSLLFRFTERDLKKEDQEAHRLTRYASADDVWTVGAG